VIDGIGDVSVAGAAGASTITSASIPKLPEAELELSKLGHTATLAGEFRRAIELELAAMIAGLRNEKGMNPKG
jgi:hypothetical protein